MSLFSKLNSLFKKPNKKNTPTQPHSSTPFSTLKKPAVDPQPIQKLQSIQKGTGTLLRKGEPGRTAMELADDDSWQGKKVRLWHKGDIILDTYKVEGIKAGAMGNVYIVEHQGWREKMAIKSPNEHMLKERSLFARVLREAESWINLGLHPNIAFCYYVRQIEDIPHIFIEYVDGGTLRDWITDVRCYDLKKGLDIAIQFCHGMEHAHTHGMIHRDIKPENILMTKQGTVKVTDFGIAQAQEKGRSTSEGIASGGEGLTTLGTTIGTYDYMSPEQYEDPHSVDKRADIYSFGVCLYEMFCGRKPYDTASQIPASVIAKEEKRKAHEPGILREDFPKDLAILLKNCCHLERDKRYMSFADVRVKLIRIYNDLFYEAPCHGEIELVELKADGLNNQAISYLDLGRRDEAIESLREALDRNMTHPEATYNLSLLEWREGAIDDLEVLRRLDNCRNNPSNDKKLISELTSYVHAERLDLRSARHTLIEYPGLYEELFSEYQLPEIKLIDILKGHSNDVLSVYISPDGRYVVSGSKDGTIKLWDLSIKKCVTKKCVTTMKGHKGDVWSVAISPDGNYVVSGSEDNTIKVWKLTKGKCVRTMEGHDNNVSSCAISPDGNYIVSGSEDETIRLWNFRTGKCLRIFEGHNKSVFSVAISPDGRSLVSGSWDSIKLWEINSGKCERTFKGHHKLIDSVAFSPDNKYIISGSWDCTLKVWELETGKCLRTMEGLGSVRSVVVSSDGKFVLSGDADKTMKVWELETGKCVRTMVGHGDQVMGVAISPSGKNAVSGSLDNSLQLWELNTETAFNAQYVLCRPKGFEKIEEERLQLNDRLSQLGLFYQKKRYQDAFSVLTDLLESAIFCEDKEVYTFYQKFLLLGKRKSMLASFSRKTLTGHSGPVNCLSVASNGRYAVSGSADNTIKLWEFKTGRCIRTLDGHKSYVFSVVISPDDNYIISGSADNNLKVWELATGKCLKTFEGHTEPVQSIAISPNGRSVLSGSSDRTLKFWDLETKKCTRTLRVKEGIYSVAITPDGRYALSGSYGAIRIWEFETGKCVRILEGHKDTIYSISITPNGRYAVSGSRDRTVKLWDLLGGNCMKTLGRHDHYVVSIAITPDSRYALSGSPDKTLKVWELETGKCICTFEGHRASVASIAISPNGTYVLSGDAKGIMKLWYLIWDLKFPTSVDWDEDLRPFLEIFLTLHKGRWNEDDFKRLIDELTFRRGYGWVRPEGIRRELKKMTMDYKEESDVDQ